MPAKPGLIRPERSKREAIREAITQSTWICFPPGEPPNLSLKAETETARAVRCPLHGARFRELKVAFESLPLHEHRMMHIETVRLAKSAPQAGYYLAAKPQMVQLALRRTPADLDVPQTIPIGQLGESHRQILIPAGKSPQPNVTLIPKSGAF